MRSATAVHAGPIVPARLISSTRCRHCAIACWIAGLRECAGVHGVVDLSNPRTIFSEDCIMKMNFVQSAVAALALGSLMLATTPVMAETISYKADLKGATEVPPNDSQGTGNLDAAYDTVSKKMTYTVTYTGLTGPATAAHFHGPAAAGANAPGAKTNAPRPP